MVLKQQLTVALLSTALLGASGAAVEVWQWHQTTRYNHAIQHAKFADAGRLGGEYGWFAQAYAEQQVGHYQQARIIYSKLEHSQDRPLRLATLFNLGNTYLEQAAGIDLKLDADRALPLLELAKVSYREVLRLDSQYWDAKYNLERALQISPDVGEQRLLDLHGLRGTVRTIISADPAGDLP